MHTNIIAKTLLIGAVALMLVGCQKESGSMQLIAESFGGSKAAVDGEHSYWVNGETVRINGETKTVVVDEESAYVTDVQEAGIYRALYPNTLDINATLNTDAVSVLIPRTYTYKESNGLQHLGVPMAAYGTSSSRLYFQHLTAALTVEIKNIYGFTIAVDSVVVESNKYQLCGEKEITLSNEITVDANISDSATDKKVKVTFDGGTSLHILAGQIRRIQVPVLPVGTDNCFTIRIGVHKVNDSIVQCNFSRTQGNNQSSYALVRNQMGYARVTFGKAFSVSASKQVILAQGNLQYVPSTRIWSFHTHQYDICEPGPVDSTERYIAGGTLPIDLFGYGTSGHDNRHPYMTSKEASDYQTSPSSIAKTDYDWGWHNAISNGGNATGQWYSLSSNEWKYLFNNRPDSIAELRYTYATINGTHKGIILFPDKYIQPNDVSLSAATFNNYSEFTAAISYEDWAKMEVAGAVFLPLAGYRSYGDGYHTGCYKIVSQYGMYWTGYSASSSQASRIRFYNKGNPTSGTESRYYGMSVRLVKDL